jgi:hypothetical protein
MRSKRPALLEYFVRQNAGRWQVLLGAQLLSEHATYPRAYRAVEAEANRAAERGRSSVGPVDGVRFEFPVQGPLSG